MIVCEGVSRVYFEDDEAYDTLWLHERPKPPHLVIPTLCGPITKQIELGD